MKKYVSALKLTFQITWQSLFFFISFPLFGQEPIPDFYRDPGLNPNRSFVNQNFNEHIDPFTGALQHHYVDLHLPGNGGFDLKVIRSYNSASVDPANLDGYQSNAGVGWNIHFGRVLKSNDTNFCANSFVSIAKNPVLELPDGSRQILATSSSPSALLMTTQRWKADCIANGLAVFSPDGTRYEMTQFATVNGGPFPTHAIYTTKITDKNGNFANITYATGNAQISSVSTNDGRTVNFTYADSGLYNRRIASISTSGQTYTFGYQLIPQYADKYNLTTVSRPGGTSWSYRYNANLGSNAGSYAMNRATYPQGGYIDYGYKFTAFDAQANPSIRTTVVGTKSISTGGSWSFNYAPGTSGSLDTTTVNTPTGTITYRHVGPNYSASGTVWMVGLLMSKSIGGVQSETYTWDKQSISNQNNLRPGQFLLKIDAGAVNAPLLSQKTIARDGATYSTTYSNFDAYGNAGTITEAGTHGGNRTTAVSYYINPTKWIINQVQNESYSGSSTTRSFDPNGNLNSISRDGVGTTYTYDSQGNITSANLPRALIHNYSNYKRGIAQSEAQPAGISISRTVSDAGNVVSETNGDGYTTSYSYDGLNRLTSINYPVGNSVSISYGAASKVAQRGALREDTNYDGFGRVVGITLGGIGRIFAVDALGRKTFESNPGASIGTSYGYDILDRVTAVVNADGTAQYISFGAGTKGITDERGLSTGYAYRAYGNPDQQFLVYTNSPVADASVSIARNTKDLVTAVMQGGFARGYGYNANYYLTSVTNPETGTTTYGRDAAGNMTSKSVGASGTTTYAYDGQNRLASVVYPGNTPAVTNTYNKTNRLISTNNSAANRNYSYDGNGNLLRESLQIDGKAFNISYAYNGNDQLNSTTYPTSGNVVSYSPDVLGRPTQVSGYVTGVGYWPSGQISQINYTNGTTTTYGQNVRQWPNSFTTQKPSGYINSSSYAYDGVGNLTSISDSIDSSYNRSLGYDAINRLTVHNGSWGSGSTSYSGSGNVNYQSFSDFGLNYSYDGNNRLSSISGSKSASYGYDSNGNISSGGGSTYTYDGVPNLRCINCANPTSSVQYQYDGTNQRISSTKAGNKAYEVFDSQGKQLISDLGQGDYIDATEFIYLAGKRIAQRKISSYRYSITSLTSSFTNPYVNQSVLLIATVSGPNPPGFITFYNGNQVIGYAAVINGKASLVVKFDSIANISLTAVYSDANITTQPSNTSNLQLSVKAKPIFSIMPFIDFILTEEN